MKETELMYPKLEGVVKQGVRKVIGSCGSCGVDCCKVTVEDLGE